MFRTESRWHYCFNEISELLPLGMRCQSWTDVCKSRFFSFCEIIMFFKFFFYIPPSKNTSCNLYYLIATTTAKSHFNSDILLYLSWAETMLQISQWMRGDFDDLFSMRQWSITLSAKYHSWHTNMQAYSIQAHIHT